MRLIDADKLKQHYAWWNDESKELFARQSPEGWDVWGNEVECSIELSQEDTPCSS